MFAKLVVIILTIGAVAATLLAARQQRLHAVNESAQAIRRIAEHDRTLWRLRGEIAERVTPQNVRTLADRLGPLAYFFQARTSSIVAVPDEDGNLHRVSHTDNTPDDAPPSGGEAPREEDGQ